jgi:hypothetical protein
MRNFDVTAKRDGNMTSWMAVLFSRSQIPGSNFSVKNKIERKLGVSNSKSNFKE